MNFFLVFLFFSFNLLCFSKTAEEWKTRAVYQILTDRFAKTNGDSAPCENLSNYCGGTFKGIQNNLDYIQELGFNAIWISPVVANTPGGYHGYWAKDLYRINENFGTEQDLIDLIRTCHERDIWVLVDVIANHIGYVEKEGDYSAIVPFSEASYYNKFVDCNTIAINDYEDQETCWLHGLPDLNQDNEFVKKTLLEWVSNFVKKYEFDGLRLDALRHVSRMFWSQFSKAAGVFTIGEVFDYDIPYLATYQGPVDSLLNFPFYSTMRYIFESGGSMYNIERYYDGASATWSDMTILGNFINNHDVPRFLHHNNNVAGYKAGSAFVMGSVGIPIIYYGDEQGYGGGADPENREPLWTNMCRDNEFFNYIKILNNFRKTTQFYKYDQIQRYADDNFYVFSRGEHLFAFTNSHGYQTRTITYHPYPDGTVLCNLFYPKDCVELKDGQFQVVLINGEVKIFSPISSEPEGQSTTAWKKLKSARKETL